MKSFPIINYPYYVRFTPTPTFEWKKYNEITDLTGYQSKIMPKLPAVIASLLINPGNRQTVIIVNSPEFHSCLLHIQFQFIAGILYMSAAYRSQCAECGRPYDEKMLKFIATLVSRALKTRFVDIKVNVGNYHLSDLAKSLRQVSEL